MSDSSVDEHLRLQYLQAMDIDVWISRARPEHEMFFAHDPATGMSDEVHEVSSESASRELEANESGVNEANLKVTSVDNWEDLEQQVASCRLCHLCESRTQTVFGTGDKRADWMFIGEAPGQNEDLEGKPFVGRAGKLLTEMIRALGLSREQVFIANVLKCRPPGNRDPKAEEVVACADYLHRQIALVQPKIILAVGRVAAQNLLQTQEPLAKLRSIVHKLDNIPLIVIYHPAYLLRSPLEKRKAWEDLQFAMKIFEGL